jgi:hypothetical protein
MPAQTLVQEMESRVRHILAAHNIEPGPARAIRNAAAELTLFYDILSNGIMASKSDSWGDKDEVILNGVKSLALERIGQSFRHVAKLEDDKLEIFAFGVALTQSPEHPITIAIVSEDGIREWEF